MSALASSPKLGGSTATIGRILFASGACVLLGVVLCEDIVTLALPLTRAVFEWIAAEFHVKSLSVELMGADRVINVAVVWKHIEVIGGNVIYPDPRGVATASTLIAHTLQGPIVAFIAALAWPTAGRGRSSVMREIGSRFCVAFPLVCVLVAVETPVVLAGELWQMILEALDPTRFSVLAAVAAFLQGGGRYAIGLFIGVVAVWAGLRVVRLRGSN